MTSAATAHASKTRSSGTAAAGVSVARTVLTTFTREQVDSALIAAGKTDKSTDSDIRRLVNVQFHMVKFELASIDGETLGDEQTSKLLDYFCTLR